MTILDALWTAKVHKRCVRPRCWAVRSPDRWVEARDDGTAQVVFVEAGTMQEMAHALQLQYEDELLGEWEEVEGRVPRS
jgi:hypothetical protein